MANPIPCFQVDIEINCLDMPVGKGHVVSFNFNPMHRDMNRGDQRMLWNAILNWQAIVEAKPTSSGETHAAPEPDDE